MGVKTSRATIARILGGLVGIGLVLWSCTGPTETPMPTTADRIGPMAAYVYASDPQDYLTAPQSFPLAPEMAPADALNALGAGQSSNTIVLPAAALEAFGDAFKLLRGRG